MCPHANEPLADAKFDGTTGDRIKGKPCKLAEFPIEIKGGEIHVDVVGIVPNRIS